MRRTRPTENLVKRACFRASPDLDKALWAETSRAHAESPPATLGPRQLRVIVANHLVKLAAAVAIILAALVLWQTVGAPGKAYALSDAIGIIGQARTIHIRTLREGSEETWEFWYDIENGRERTHHEGVYQKTYDSPETYKVSVTTVQDEQYVMAADHEKRTVRFERLLSWERELDRLEMADLAMNTVLPSVLRHLNQFTRIGKGDIDGQSYDIWRREWRDTKSNYRLRYDIWLSPATGEIGRTREWRLYPDVGRGKVEWVLYSETDKIEINREPPAGTFATEPPDGYVLENSKATADILRTDFLLRRDWQQGYELYALPGFMLEDGSIVAIWTVAGGPARPDLNDAYKGLTLGGPLPETPFTLPGLIFVPAGQRYGSVYYGDESTPFTLIDAVGRHLMATRKADRVYEWALYVSQKAISSQEPRREIITVIKRNVPEERRPPMGLSSLKSLPVTRERLAQYVSDAVRELSEDPDIPAFIAYESLLNLAAQIRSKRDLYEAFAEQTKEVREEDIGLPEPVEVTPLDEGK